MGWWTQWQGAYCPQRHLIDYGVQVVGGVSCPQLQPEGTRYVIYPSHLEHQFGPPARANCAEAFARAGTGCAVPSIM